MPELPEVQTVVNSLIPKLKNKKIIDFNNSWHRILYSNNYTELNKTIYKQAIHHIYRNGKYIIIDLNKYYIIFHLRMTGYLYHSNILKKSKHLQCYFTLDDKTYLLYEDIRKFGGFYYLKNLNIINQKLGMDPFNKNFNYNWMKINILSKKRKMKSLLLDQKFICGLGNIYIDEILWLSKIHPLALSHKLKENEIEILTKNIKKILSRSIKHHGTTIFNFKFDNMKTGSFKKYLNVYGRNKKSCIKCNNRIIKIKISGRGTYLCSYCQRLSN